MSIKITTYVNVVDIFALTEYGAAINRGVDVQVTTVDEKRLYVLLGRKIKEIRQNIEPKLSQAELASRLGIERTSVTNLESGTQRAPLHLIYRLCAELSVQPQNVFPSLDEIANKEISIGDKTQSIPPKTAMLIDRLRNER